MSAFISSYLFIALMEAGWEKDRLLAAVEKVTKSEHPLSASLALLLEANVGDEKLLEVMAGLERDYVGEYRRLKLAVPPPRYQRAPRTKKYGPAQDPDSYFSAEKVRVYNHAAGWVDAAPVERLGDKDWWPLVGQVFRRDGFVCTYCGADSDDYLLHCDHIIPISRGGANELENLTTACEFCNCSKRDLLPQEWRPIRAVPQ